MPKKIPMRKCVGCGEMREKSDLIRIIRTPEDEIMIDRSGRANGRGAYICNDPQCLKLAMKNKGLERSLKYHVPTDILEQMAKEIG